MSNHTLHPRWKKTIRALLWVLLVLLFIPVLAVLLFQTAPVQNFAKEKAESFLRNKFHTTISIGQIKLTWWNSILLKNVYLGDRRQNTLLSSGSLKAGVNLLSLLNNRLVVNKLDWEDVLLNVYRSPGDTAYNYQFIIDAFASPDQEKDTLAGTPMTYSVGNVSITNCRLRFMDDPGGMALNVKWKALRIRPEDIVPDQARYTLNKVELTGLRGIISRKYIATPLIAADMQEEIAKSDTADSPLYLAAGRLALNDCYVGYNDESSGLNTNWRIQKIEINKAVFDASKNSIGSDAVLIHRTGGSLSLGKGLDTTSVVKEDTVSSATPWVFGIKKIDVDQLGFTYNQLAGPVRQQPGKPDFNHLQLKDIRLQTNGAYYSSDSIRLDLKELALEEKSGFAIRKGEGQLLYTDQVIALEDFLLETKKSAVAAGITLQAPSFATISDNLNLLQVAARLDKVYLDLPELSGLLPDLEKNPSLRPILRKQISATGNISGSMADLRIDRLQVNDRDGTQINLSGTVRNAGNPDRLVAMLSQIDLHAGEKALKSWVPAGTIPDSIAIPSWLHLQGSAIYSKSDLQADLRFTSAMGNISLRGRAGEYLDKSRSRYQLAVPLLDIDLGKLLRDTTMGPVKASLSAKGEGYDYKTLTATMQLQIKEAFYKNYRYHDIQADAALDKGNYNVSVQSADSNALATVRLEGLLDSLKTTIRGLVDVKRFDMYATHWSASHIAARAAMTVDVKSLEPRKLNGAVIISQVQFADDSTVYPLDSIHLLATDTGNQQQISLTGPFGYLTAAGDYDYTRAFTDLSAMLHRHLQPAGHASANSATEEPPTVNSQWPAVSTDSAYAAAESPASGAMKEKESRKMEPPLYQTQLMVLDGSLKWPASLKKLVPALQMNQPLTLKGRLNTDSSLFSLSFLLPGLAFQEFRLDTLRGHINSNAAELGAGIYLSRLSHPRFPLEQTTFIVNARNGILEADANLRDKTKTTKYAFGALVEFLPGNGWSASLKPALTLNKDNWQASENNKVVIKQGALQSADLTLSSAGQSLAISTRPSGASSENAAASPANIAASTESVASSSANVASSSRSIASSVSKPQGGSSSPDLIISLDKFRLSTLTAILAKDSLFAEGVASGQATITGYDKTPLINARLKIDSLRMMKTSIGTLAAEVSSSEQGEYAIKANLTGNDNDVAVNGRYGQALDFTVDLRKLNMASIEPLTMGSIKRMSGITTGQLTLNGTTDAPRIRGALKFDNVAASVTAIGTYLKLPANELVFDDQGIRLNEFIIRDSLNNEAMIDGSILTKNYKDFRFQLDLLAENFMAIGPKSSGEQMIYGPAFVDADAKIRGTTNLPRVDLTLALKDSSDFTIVLPESEPGIAEREGVIAFVDKDNQRDSSLLQIKDTINIRTPDAFRGLAMTARVEITPRSTIKVVIDQQNGDYLEIKGKANLDAVMSPNADPSVTGRYEIDEGSYNLSLNTLIKRKFNIEKGSTITLQGDLMKAIVDITARYRVEAIAGDLVQDQLSGASDTRRTQFRQKVPVDVYLIIKNELLKPDISFRIDMPERERNVLNGVVYSRIKQINLVESELNKQVMGLLVLNSFIPENPMALLNDRGGGVEQTARKSVSKLISQQLNNFAGSLIKGFDVNFDLESGEDYSTGKAETSTNLNVGVSKSLFNDRISVSVGSSVNLEGAQQTQQASTLVGDVSVDYKITPDGRYRLRAYRQNETDAIVEGQIVETGASFIYVVDYNELRELLHRKKDPEKKKRIKKKNPGGS